MADGGGFKHIVLNAADDDEVIMAGLPAGEAHGSAFHPEDAADALQDGAVSAAGEAETLDGSCAKEVISPVGGLPASKGGTVSDAGPSRSSQRPPHGEDDLQTTLDDLKPAPIPMTQRIVIIAAVLLIIVALVYYFAVMR